MFVRKLWSLLIKLRFISTSIICFFIGRWRCDFVKHFRMRHFMHPLLLIIHDVFGFSFLHGLWIILFSTRFRNSGSLLWRISAEIESSSSSEIWELPSGVIISRGWETTVLEFCCINVSDNLSTYLFFVQFFNNVIEFNFTNSSDEVSSILSRLLIYYSLFQDNSWCLFNFWPFRIWCHSDKEIWRSISVENGHSILEMFNIVLHWTNEWRW